VGLSGPSLFCTSIVSFPPLCFPFYFFFPSNYVGTTYVLTSFPILHLLTDRMTAPINSLVFSHILFLWSLEFFPPPFFLFCPPTLVLLWVCSSNPPPNVFFVYGFSFLFFKEAPFPGPPPVAPLPLPGDRCEFTSICFTTPPPGLVFLRHNHFSNPSVGLFLHTPCPTKFKMIPSLFLSHSPAILCILSIFFH